jgi:hypothetical protein
LQKKIQERIFAAISAEFPNLKLPPEGNQRHFAFHIERTPEGSFSIHSADPNADVFMPPPTTNCKIIFCKN